MDIGGCLRRIGKMAKEINYFETYTFGDFPYYQPYPVYSVSESSGFLLSDLSADGKQPEI